LNEGKIINIYNGVDVEQFVPNLETRKKLRKELYFDDGDVVIGYIGTISTFEGLDYLINCVNLLSSNVKLLIIGGGSYKDRLLEIAKGLNLGNRLIYLGKMQFPAVIDYYNVIDIVAYPRKNNILCDSTGSYKLYEAMAMEKPIIVSRLKPYLEVVDDGNNGLICECDNENSLLEKCKNLVNNVELREKLGKNAREWVVANRDWKKFGK